VQLDNKNIYNTLGRLGPIYPRPEYRPPAKEEAGGAGSGAGSFVKKGGGKGSAPSESLILAQSLKKKSQSAPAAQERLNLAGAEALVEESAGLIKGLQPEDAFGCPHKTPDGVGLLCPSYV
jgi:hypothetical protein